MRLIHYERASKEVLTIASANASLCELVTHLDETKAPGLTGESVCSNID
jgi:hypothetical protein